MEEKWIGAGQSISQACNYAVRFPGRLTPTSYERASTLPNSSDTLLGMKHYDEPARLRLGLAVSRARHAAGYADTGKWADAIKRSTRVALGVERGEQAGVNTYSAIEDALGWLRGTCYRILGGLDPDEVIGQGTVGGDAQDARRGTEDHVNAPGETVESGITNEDLLREIVRSRAEFDQIRAEVRDDIESLSQRVARLEQRGS